MGLFYLLKYSSWITTNNYRLCKFKTPVSLDGINRMTGSIDTNLWADETISSEFNLRTIQYYATEILIKIITDKDVLPIVTMETWLYVDLPFNTPQ